MLNLDQVMIEVTQRCNMTCSHCLRGNARDVDLNDNTNHWIGRILNGSYIHNLTITGGEPSLNLDAIKQLKQNFIWNNISVGNIFVVTNNMDVPEEFFEFMRDWMQLAGDGEVSAIAFSADDYHDDHPEKSGWELKDWGEYNGVQISEHTKGTFNLIAMGRGASMGGRTLTIYPYIFDQYNEDEDINIEGQIYINANGDIFPECNLSYEVMDNANDLRIGNVRNAPDLLGLCKDFNAKLANYGPSIEIDEYNYEMLE